jgi:hypothetical protein
MGVLSFLKHVYRLLTEFSYFLQNILHIASADKRKMIGIDTTSGSQLYSVQINTGQPFAIHVYNAETSIPYNGNDFMNIPQI